MIFNWSGNKPNGGDFTVCNLDGIEDIYIETLIEEYKISYEIAKQISAQVWINIFGMASLILGGVLDLKEEEISAKVSQVLFAVVSSFIKPDINEEEIDDYSLEEPDEEFIEEFNEFFFTEIDAETEQEQKKEKEKIFSWLD